MLYWGELKTEALQGVVLDIQGASVSMWILLLIQV